MDTKKLRSWWFHRQGLDGRLRGESASKVLGDTGWARSVGGAAPYLTLFSRSRLSREKADAAAAGLEIHELPAARGCTYVVPACDFALALKAASGFGDAEQKVGLPFGNDPERLPSPFRVPNLGRERNPPQTVPQPEPE